MRLRIVLHRNVSISNLADSSALIITTCLSVTIFPRPPSTITDMFAAPILRNAASSSSATASAFSQAHKSYVKSLYRRYLKNSLDWCIRRDVWRDRAIEIRVEFERHRNVRNPRELANLFEKAERELKRTQHPDPHRRKFSVPFAFTGYRWVGWLPIACMVWIGSPRDVSPTRSSILSKIMHKGWRRAISFIVRSSNRCPVPRLDKMSS